MWLGGVGGEEGGGGERRGEGLHWRFASVAFCWVASLVTEKRRQGWRERERGREGERVGGEGSI